MAGDVISGEVIALLSRVRLDWSGPEHWDDDVMKPCVSCKTPTHGRVGETALHQSCAEDLLAEQVGRRYEQALNELLAERFAAPTRTLGGAR